MKTSLTSLSGQYFFFLAFLQGCHFVLCVRSRSSVSSAGPELRDGQTLKFFDPLVCRNASAIVRNSNNIRESLVSSASGSISRQRALALGVLHYASSHNKAHYSCLNHLSGGDFEIWNTEANAAIHNVLATLNLKTYITSEFMSPSASSGDIINGVRHEDLMSPSVAPNSVDLIISAEVFEHIPEPYTAHKALFKVLRAGGAHVFTVPFTDQGYDIVMSRMLPNGTVIHGPGQPPQLVSPQYHGDPLRKEGILVFTIFSREMVSKLVSIGYVVKMLNIQNHLYGVYNSNIVFIARKPYQK
jgi:hypothetical protein